MVSVFRARLRERRKERASARVLQRRRGLSTAWLLLFGPVFLVLLAIVVEIGNLYVAQAQLENALEAAALAAVLEWGGEPPAASTQDARLVGEEYGNVNEVCGQRLGDFDPIDPNYQPAPTGDANDNASCTGDLVFGAISFAEPFVFQANVEPQCEVRFALGNASMVYTVNTGTRIRTTYGNTIAFEIGWEPNQPSVPDLPPGYYLAKVTLQLQAQSTDNGQFDFDLSVPPPTLPPGEDLGNGAIREGWGPFYNSSLSTGLTTPPQFFQDEAGTVPISTGQSDVLTIVFAPNDFNETDFIFFGVDTDMVGDGLGDANDTADQGGEFKDAGDAFTVTFTFSDGTTSGSYTIVASDSRVKRQGDSRTEIPRGQAISEPIEVLIPGTGSYAVHAQKKIGVPSLCGGVLGINTTWDVCAEATAMWRCFEEDVSLVHLSDFQCTEP